MTGPLVFPLRIIPTWMDGRDDSATVDSFEEMQKHVFDYFQRHEKNVIDGSLTGIRWEPKKGFGRRQSSDQVSRHD
jgi:hypothetical protein